jgi:hypothetical protein
MTETRVGSARAVNGVAFFCSPPTVLVLEKGLFDIQLILQLNVIYF